MLSLKLPCNQGNRSAPFSARCAQRENPPTDEEETWLKAVYQFRNQNRHWPTACEYLWIAKKLGYALIGAEGSAG